MPRPSWIPKLLDALSIPDTPQNSLTFDLWSLSEDSTYVMQNTAHNYIAIIWPESTLPPWNSFPCGSSTCHVQRYHSEAEGVQATARFLRQPQYFDLLQTFREPDSPMHMEDIYLAINRSPACGGCQGGRYPIALYKYVLGHAPPKEQKRLKPPLYGIPPAPKKAAKPANLLNGWAYFTRVLHGNVPREAKRAKGQGLIALNIVKYRATRPRKP